MTTPKSLTMVAALLVAGTSLALAQNGLPTGGEPPVAGGAAGNPPVLGPPGPGIIPGAPLQSAAPATRTRIVHHHMYMSAHHKTLKTGQQPQ
ncbi:MAG: hypothetical protein WBD11_05610 [Xanthobacteraceae bacterium]